MSDINKIKQYEVERIDAKLKAQYKELIEEGLLSKEDFI